MFHFIFWENKVYFLAKFIQVQSNNEREMAIYST